MDKKRASQILGLGPGATRKEAKKSFRSLAKSWHPDRFAGDPEAAKTAEARMKEINGAFHFLVSLLPVGLDPVETREEKTKKGPGFFSSVRERWEKRTRSKFRRGSGPTVPKNRTTRSKRPVPKKPDRRPAKSPGFQTLLNTLEPNLTPNFLKTTKPVKSFDNYCRYMAVKKRTKGARSRSDKMGIGRVEKIVPVQRVNPIGGK